MSEIVLREFRPEDSLEKLTDLLHAAYAPVLKQGIHFFAATQSVEHTRERITRAHVAYLGLHGEDMAATISLYRAVPNHRCEHYRNAWWFGQFAVRPDMQRTGIGTALIELVEQRAKADGCGTLALDTAENAHDLITYYEKRGFEFVQYQQWPDVRHRSVILSKKL